jgi:hypothetical protein
VVLQWCYLCVGDFRTEARVLRKDCPFCRLLLLLEGRMDRHVLCVAGVLQECCKRVLQKSVARVLQEFYKSVTRLLREYRQSVARVFKEHSVSVTRVLQ